MVWGADSLMGACFAGAVITVMLRWYARTCILGRTGFEDFLVTGALVASMVWFACFHVADRLGFGSPMSNIPVENHEALLKVMWFGPAWWGLSSALCKLSIVWQYRRVFPSKNVRKVCDLLIILLIAYGAWSFLGCIFRCFPLRSMWDHSVQADICIDMRLLHYSCYAINLFMDITIFAMPIPLIRALQIPQQQKKALLVVFSFGAFTIFASIMRLVVMPSALTSKDMSHDAKPVTVWSGIEMYACIICACLAVLKPLLAKILPSFVQSLAVSASKRSGSGYKSLSTEDDRESIPWDDPMLAKTIQTYRTVEISSESISEWNNEVRLAGNRTECSYGHHKRNQTSGNDSD